MYKILIIKHNLAAGKQYTRELLKLKDFFSKRIPMEVQIDEVDSNGALTFKAFEGNAKVTKGTYSKEGFDIARKLAEPYEYQQVLFLFDHTREEDYKRVQALGGTVNPVALFQELFTGTRYTESSSISWVHIAHESIHAMCQLANSNGSRVLDHMDSTIVDGVQTWYYKNSEPYAEDGNYSRTLKELDKAWDIIQVNKRSLIGKQLELLTAKVKALMNKL